MICQSDVQPFDEFDVDCSMATNTAIHLVHGATQQQLPSFDDSDGGAAVSQFRENMT